MGQQPKTQINPTGTLTVLSVSPIQEDHSTLESIMGYARWTVLRADKLPAVPPILRNHRDISVVLCERDLISGTWIDILTHIQPMPNPPSLIVTSRLADDRLWAEALNLGAWDVLAKPFDRCEVLRSVRSAWQHWNRLVELIAKPARVMTAARAAS